MSESLFHNTLLYSWLGLAAITFPVLFFVAAPYGRYTRSSWGPRIDRTWGWVIMEAPSSLGILLFFILGNRHANLTAWIFLLIWQAHYIHRAFIFPFRMRGEAKRLTLVTVALGVVFNLGNSYLNGRYLFTLSPLYPAQWLLEPRFLVGAALFFLGLSINIRADNTLIRLRTPGDKGYRIPRGGLFEYVSCPNYLGELIEWFGWALATWSLSGLTFALWTAANLAPRARTHHRWYRKQFADYPERRKALVPYLF